MEQPLIADRYRPLELLGEGSFGSVVAAFDTRMQRRVAIKRLPLPLDAAGVPVRPAGLAEARTAAMLNHPAIVTVFDFETDADEAFLVMEYVDGASLAELLADVGGALTLDEAAAVVDAVSEALIFAHDNGVLHLDIKPENVLVTRDGRVKVADFGIAELSSLSGHGTAFGGTIGYMPLEQLRGDAVSEATDEWALGAMAFELLTGDNPFVDASVDAAIRHLQTAQIPRVHVYDRELPVAIDDALAPALARDPLGRYPSVADFADELVSLLGDARAGRASLAELVAELVEDEPDDFEELAHLGLWDRLQGPLGMSLVRGAAAVEAGWLAWVGLGAVGLERLALIAAVALVAVAGAFAPSLGLVLGLLCVALGAALHGAWTLTAIVVLVGGGWWWLFGRHSSGAAVLPLAAPVLATMRLGLLQPLLAGFALPPLGAAVAALLGGVLTMLAATASSATVPLLEVAPTTAVNVWSLGAATEGVRAALLSPAAYVALLSWPLAAIVMSLFSSRATRAAAALGALLGAAVLAGGYLLADLVARTLNQQTGYESVLAAASLAGSLILMWLVTWLGAPVRPEEEDPLSVATSRREDD